MQEEMLHIVSS